MIFSPNLDAFNLNSEISFEDFDGNAKLIVPIRKDITTKIINNSIKVFNLVYF
jgi:hypothetical protein